MPDTRRGNQHDTTLGRSSRSGIAFSERARVLLAARLSPRGHISAFELYHGRSGRAARVKSVAMNPGGRTRFLAGVTAHRGDMRPPRCDGAATMHDGAMRRGATASR